MTYNLSNKKIKLILKASQDIFQEKAEKSESIGFMSRSFVQATLPHSDPGDVDVWGRVNGKYSLTIQPGYSQKNGGLVNVGLPYGSIPRLILMWLTGEVIKHKKREIFFGSSLSSFMRTLGLNPDRGGERSDAHRLQDQMKRLFSSRISFSYDDDDSCSRKNIDIAEDLHLFWSKGSPAQSSINGSSVILGQSFFDEIISNPVPLDLRVISVLKQSPLSLDIYSWLTYRVSYLNKPQLVTWVGLQKQFGSEYNRIRDFRGKFRKSLAQIKTLYPNLKISDGVGGVTLYPSATHVAKKAIGIKK